MWSFRQIGAPACGCPYNKSPTFWVSILGPLICFSPQVDCSYSCFVAGEGLLWQGGLHSKLAILGRPAVTALILSLEQAELCFSTGCCLKPVAEGKVFLLRPLALNPKPKKPKKDRKTRVPARGTHVTTLSSYLQHT